MLLQFLEYVRRQPKPVRSQYALGLTLGFMVVVVGVWSLSLPERFTALGSDRLDAGQIAAAPFAGVWGELKDQVADWRALLSGTEIVPPPSPNLVDAAIANALDPATYENRRTTTTTAAPEYVLIATSSATSSTEVQ